MRLVTTEKDDKRLLEEGFSPSFLQSFHIVSEITRTDPARSRQLCLAILPEAERIHDPDVLADVKQCLGNACFMDADSLQAIGMLNEAADLYHEHHHPMEAGKALSMLGVIFMNQGNLAAAMEAYTREYMNVAAEDQPATLFTTNFHLAQVYEAGLQHEMAMDCLIRAEELLRDHPEIMMQTETIPMFIATYVISLLHEGRNEKAAYELEYSKDIMKSFPRFQKGPYDLVPWAWESCARNGKDKQEKLDAAAESCCRKDLNTGENMTIIASFARLLLEEEDWDNLHKVLHSMHDHLEGTDYYQYSLVESRCLQAYYRHNNRMDDYFREVDRYWKIDEKRTENEGRFAVLYMNMKHMLSKAAMENAMLEKTARLDELTGVANRHMLRDEGARMLAQAREQQIPLTVLMLDVDCFKQINDSLGHLNGDFCLKTIGEILQEYADETTLPARYGGDEFLLMSMEPLDTQAVYERTLAEFSVKVKEKLGIDATVSQGSVCRIPGESDTLESFIMEADEGLYKAKRSGRGRACQVMQQ